jgi:asparagine synthase (glutamine-hydrolysing)
MFAFAVYDAAQHNLLLARDRLGIKPLYYARTKDGFLAASEARPLVHHLQPALSREDFSAYEQWGACQDQNLIFSDISSLPAGHWGRVDAGGSITLGRYWPPKNLDAHYPAAEPTAEIRRLLEQAVQEHLLADVPVAVLLSGGTDSSIITALAAQKYRGQLQTFSVGFAEQGFDESPYARIVASRYRTQHCAIRLTESEVLASVVEGIRRMDLPTIDGLNTYVVSRAIAARGIKVAISGLGGDELFGGYASFRDVRWLRLLACLPRTLFRALGVVSPLARRLADMPGTTDTGTLALWRRRFWTDEMLASAGLSSAHQSSVTPPHLSGDFAPISWAELTSYMRNTLLRDSDQMSMACSIELRIPFLDHELVEYVLQLPEAEMRRWPGSKGLLIAACKDLLPEGVYNRRKMGFSLPMDHWMRGPLRSLVEESLSDVTELTPIRPAVVRKMRAQFNAGGLHWTRLWSLVVLGHYLHKSAEGRQHKPESLCFEGWRP